MYNVHLFAVSSRLFVQSFRATVPLASQCPVESTLPQAHHRITITSTSTLRQAHALMKHIVNCTSTSTTLLPQGCALMKVHYKHKHIINCTSTLLQARAPMKALPQAAPDHFLSCLFKPLIHKQEHCLHPTKHKHKLWMYP